jgi:hypothetical protein
MSDYPNNVIAAETARADAAEAALAEERAKAEKAAVAQRLLASATAYAAEIKNADGNLSMVASANDALCYAAIAYAKAIKEDAA